jgi:hypothetical protein
MTTEVTQELLQEQGEETQEVATGENGEIAVVR